MIIVVQKNKICHLINRLQIEKFAHANNWDIIIFPAKYYQTKKDDSNLIQHELLFKAQDGEENFTGPDLLFYCREMPAYLLANQYIHLSIVNSARAIIHWVLSYPNNKITLSEIIKIPK